MQSLLLQFRSRRTPPLPSGFPVRESAIRPATHDVPEGTPYGKGRQIASPTKRVSLASFVGDMDEAGLRLTCGFRSSRECHGLEHVLVNFVFAAQARHPEGDDATLRAALTDLCRGFRWTVAVFDNGDRGVCVTAQAREEGRSAENILRLSGRGLPVLVAVPPLR